MHGEPEADDMSASRRMLGLLEGIRRTSVGTVIYDQIARLVEEQEGVQAKVDHVYASLLHLLLDAYAREPTADHITRLHARLIRLRYPSPPPARGAPSGKVEEQIRMATGAPAEAVEPMPAAERPEEKQAGREFAEPRAKAEGVAERRVESAYRQHLDRTRDEIAKLQEALDKSVTEAIIQNREFGALLQTELQALHQAESAKEVEHLRRILVGGLEELIRGQHSLDSKLHRTGSYLKAVKADSERLREELSKVRLLSLTDEFTGLPNRRAFIRRLQDEIGRAQRYGSPLALAMIDIDEFKAINDAHGHAAGDAVLRCYATDVLTVLRHHDMVARYGGEEFAVLLPNTAREGAIAAITKVRNRLGEMQCDVDGLVLPMPTFSTGIALYIPGETHTDLIDRADRALYSAKRLGRNRIEFESAVPPPSGEPQSPGRTNGA